MKRVKLHIKNQLNKGLEIDFCVGYKEYSLKHDEEITIEVEDEDCVYFDIVK